MDMTGFSRCILHPHPSTPIAGLTLEVEAARRDGLLSLEYRLGGAVDAVFWPEPTARERTDGLWRTTCFEAFAGGGVVYAEYNLSPSGAWAAYAFDGYRKGMRPLEQIAPMIVTRRARGLFALTADVVLPDGADGRTGLSAVIQTLDGRVSYWALAHPSDKPDFHHPDSFMLELP